MAHSIKRIRTMALVGQAGCGKTSLAEALLAKAGAIPAPGSVERGTTVCDYTPLEKQLQHSLKLAVASFDFQETRIHLLDTPGYPDFLGHALPALAAVETAAIVINAQNGIEMMTGALHAVGGEARPRPAGDRQQDRRRQRRPRGAARAASSRPSARNACRSTCPRRKRSRVSDCFFAPSGEADFSSVEEAHRKLVDQVVEVDEKLMATYLEKGEVTPEELHEPLERALREGHLIPVVFTSAKTGAGIAELLDVIVKLLPNPAEGNPPAYITVPGRQAASAAELQPVPDPGRHVLAHVFKIEIDPYIGRLAVFRVHQGRITPGTQLYIGEGRKPVKAGHLYLLQGKTADRSERGDAGRHLRHRQDRRDPVRPHPARLGLRRARARAAARAADPGVRPRGAAEEARRRAEGVRRAAQDHRRGSLLPHRAQRAGERDRDARPGRDPPARRCSRRCRRSTSSSSTRGRRRSPTARPSRRAPTATAATRSRPAAPASSARCTSRSSRCRAARASSSSTA